MIWRRRISCSHLPGQWVHKNSCIYFRVETWRVEGECRNFRVFLLSSRHVLGYEDRFWPFSSTWSCDSFVPRVGCVCACFHYRLKTTTPTEVRRFIFFIFFLGIAWFTFFERARIYEIPGHYLLQCKFRSQVCSVTLLFWRVSHQVTCYWPLTTVYLWLYFPLYHIIIGGIRILRLRSIFEVKQDVPEKISFH